MAIVGELSDLPDSRRGAIYLSRKLLQYSLIIAVGLSLLIVAGCARNNKAIKPADTEGIKISLVSAKEMPSGTAYSLRLTNDTSNTIKQNSVYINYPINTHSVTTTNKCKVEATNNKLDIKPGETLLLSAFMPLEDYQNNKYLDRKHPQFEISGYINDLTPVNSFTRSGNL
jgi:hypothetical protein